MDELALRPLRDMETMPWVRGVCLRTRWSTNAGEKRQVDVTVERADGRYEDAAFQWKATGEIDGEWLTLNEFGEIGELYESPLAAYDAAQSAIADRLNTDQTEPGNARTTPGA